MKHPLRSTGEAGIEPALTVLETAFLPLEDSPLNMSRRGLLPDPFAVLTHPQNRIYFLQIGIYSEAGHSSLAPLAIS